MLDSPILQVIIGMIFIFSLFSVLVTQLNTLLSNALNLRARHLKQGILNLVHDPMLSAKILSHPLVELVTGEDFDEKSPQAQAQAEAMLEKGVNAVTWLDPETFVDVLVELILSSDQYDIYRPLYEALDALPPSDMRRELRLITTQVVTGEASFDDLILRIRQIPDVNVSEHLLDITQQVRGQVTRVGAAYSEEIELQRLESALRDIRDDALRKSMETLLATSKTLGDARARLTKWFNAGMSRVSETFGRDMQRMSLATGLVLAIMLNLDALHIARTLWEDPTLRAGVVAAAEQQANINELEALFIEAQAALETDENPSETVEAFAESMSTSIVAAQQTIDQALTLNLPLGWVYYDPVARAAAQATDDQTDDESGAADVANSEGTENVTSQAAILERLRRDPRNLWNYFNFSDLGMLLELWAGKLVGLIVMTIALAQGAPFWFNLLRRLTGGGQSNSSDS